MVLCLKKKTRKTSNRTGIRLASKAVNGHRPVIYSKYSTYAQEAREQIDGSILKEFFLTCFIRMNTGLRPLFNIKPCIRFHIESI